jgi:Zn-dependent protease with chaperone function
MDEINAANFFQWQKETRKWSFYFIAIFMIGALAWFGVLYKGLDLTNDYLATKQISLLPQFINQLGMRSISDPLLLTILFAIFTICCSIYKVIVIRRNGSTYFTTALGGVPLGETEPVLGGEAGPERETILRNVVSEMSLAASVPEPDIYILPLEYGVNALTVGLSPDDAAIMVTRGALKYLTRDELSGLIGHELSHIINGDMRHNTLMAGWLDGFFSLTSVGIVIIRCFGPRSFWVLPLGFFLLVLGFLGHLTGELIQAAFNRRRESMADAYATQFTRDPTCLAGVLKKIGGLDQGSYIQVKKKPELDCRHLFIAESDKSLFQTHPPLAHRIWALEPNWSGYWHDFEKDPVDFLPEATAPDQAEALALKWPQTWWRRVSQWLKKDKKTQKKKPWWTILFKS